MHHIFKCVAAGLLAAAFLAAPADALDISLLSAPVNMATSAGQASSVPSVLRSPSDFSSESLTRSGSDSEGSDLNPQAVVQTRVARDPADLCSASLAHLASGEGALIATLFSLKEMPKTLEDVTVVGSWSEWTEHVKLLNKGVGRFEGLLDLPAGDHQFKFILDDEWTCSEQWPVALAHDGMLNNVVSVVAPAPALREAASAYVGSSKNLKDLKEAATAGELASPNGGVLGSLVSVILFPFRAVLFVVLAPFNLANAIFAFLFRRDRNHSPKEEGDRNHSPKEEGDRNHSPVQLEVQQEFVPQPDEDTL